MNLTDLRKLAKAATPGPWFATIDPCDPDQWEMWQHDPNEPKGYGAGMGVNWRKKDAKYISAANPRTVLALLDRIDDLMMLLGLDEPGNENGWEDLVKHMRKTGEWDDYEVKKGEACRGPLNSGPGGEGE